MIQIIINLNYHINSIDYSWNKSIIISDDKDLLDITLEDAKDYLRIYTKPLAINILYENLKFIKGIENKEQIKSMIKSGDLACITEVVFFDISRLPTASWYIYDKHYSSFAEFEKDILVFKEYLLDYKFNRYSLYYGDKEPDLSYNYTNAEYRINFMNKTAYPIGNVVDFIDRRDNLIKTGVIVSKASFPNFIELDRYDIALLTKVDDKYCVEELISADDIIKSYDKLNNFKVVKECVLDDNIWGDFLKYDDFYKAKIREYLKDKL